MLVYHKLFTFYKACCSIKLLVHIKECKIKEKSSKTENRGMTDTTYVDGWLVSLTNLF